MINDLESMVRIRASAVNGLSKTGSALLACDCHGRRDLFFQICRTRLVDAERLLVEIVAGGCIGACAATHANVSELTASALPLQVVDIAQLIEHYRVLPDIGERLLSQIPCQGR